MDSLILKISIPFIGILLSIIGFFIALFIKRLIGLTDRLDASVSRLELTITSMRGEIRANDNKFESFTGGCTDRHKTVDRRLDSHGNRLDEHDKDIAVLLEKTK